MLALESIFPVCKIYLEETLYFLKQNTNTLSWQHHNMYEIMKLRDMQNLVWKKEYRGNIGYALSINALLFHVNTEYFLIFICHFQLLDCVGLVFMDSHVHTANKCDRSDFWICEKQKWKWFWYCQIWTAFTCKNKSYLYLFFGNVTEKCHFI